jgi:predicted nucleic acid-binding protein
VIVVDTTVLGDLWFNGGELRASAVELLTLDPEWIGMELVRYELGNVARSQVVFSALGESDARLGLEGAEETLAEIVQDADWMAVLHLAVVEDLSYYDASHVWLARSRGLKLRTRDKGVLAKCPDVAVAMPEV